MNHLRLTRRAAGLVLLNMGVALARTPVHPRVDAQQLNRFRDHVEQTEPRIRGVVVLRDGQTVFEYYRKGLDASSPHHGASVTKSVISMLVAIAIQRGEIEGVDETLSQLLEEARGGGIDARVQAMRLKDLLTMATGFAPTTSDPALDYREFYQRLEAGNVAKGALTRTIVQRPGSSFHYSNLDAHLVSLALTRRTGQSALAYARAHLFAPLGLDANQVTWSTSSEGVSNGASELYMPTGHLARLGQLTLQQGAWQGRQALSKAYLADATRPHLSAPSSGTLGHLGYGYLFWTTPGYLQDLSAWFAAGHGGQLIYVIKERDTVIAINSESMDAEHRSGAQRTARVMRDLLLPAILP